MSSFESEDNCERFGRVFLKDRDTKEEHHELKPIHTACFSNLDWRWYDVCGDIHPKYKTCSEKSFSIGFKLNLEDNDSKLFEVTLRLPLKLGAVGMSHDMEHLRQAQRMERELAMQLKFITSGENDPVGKFFKEASTASLLIFMTPGKDLLRENNFLLHLIPFLYFNEIIESNKSSSVAELKNKVPYKTMSVIPKAVSNILKGNGSDSITSPMELAQIASSGNVSIGGMFELRRLYSSLLKLTRGIYEEALKFGTHSEVQPFFQVLMNCCDSIFLQMSEEWNSMDSSFLMKAKLRSTTGPTILASEAIALQCGVIVGCEIRRSSVFKQFLNEIAIHTSKVHDIMSYNKENEQTSSLSEHDNISCQNEIQYLHNVCQWPLEKALQKITDDANKSMARLGEIGNLLLRLFDNNENLTNYIEIVYKVISGYIQWLGFAQYYHSNLTFDCYVEE